MGNSWCYFLALWLLEPWTCIPFWNPFVLFSGIFFCGLPLHELRKVKGAPQFVSKATTWERQGIILHFLPKTSVISWRFKFLCFEKSSVDCWDRHESPLSIIPSVSTGQCSVSLTFSCSLVQGKVALHLHWHQSNPITASVHLLITLIKLTQLACILVDCKKHCSPPAKIS